MKIEENNVSKDAQRMKMDFSKIDNEITNVADKSLLTERDGHDKMVKAFDISTNNLDKTSFGTRSNM